ncbi:MAG: hypothetical protein ACOZB0_02085 [Pseudomonadota bacterium]
MTDVKRRRKKDGPRTEVFAMRLDPKLKYLAEIAARKQRRSLANFIEWAVEQALSKVMLVETADFNGQYDRSVLDEAGKLWDLEPSDRFLKLAEHYSDLMTYEEQRIWKAVHEIAVTEYQKDDAGKIHSFKYEFLAGPDENKYPWPPVIKDCWSVLVAYGAGEATDQDVKDALKEHAIPF